MIFFSNFHQSSTQITQNIKKIHVHILAFQEIFLKNSQIFHRSFLPKISKKIRTHFGLK